MNSMEFRHLRAFCDRHGLDYQEIDDKLTYWENKDNLQQLSMGAGDIDMLDRPHTRVSSIILSKREEVRAAKSSAVEYLNTMANEMGLKLMSVREHKRLTSGGAIIGPRLRQPKIERSKAPMVRIVIGQHKKKPKPGKKRSLFPSRKPDLLRKIRQLTKQKGMAHVSKDLGIETNFRNQILNPLAKKILGNLARKGIIYSPRPSYYAVTGTPDLKGAAREAKAITTITAIAEKARAARKPRKRQRLHTERSGRNMRVLKKAQENGVRVFSFGDDVWKTKTTRPRSRRKRR